MHLFKVQERLKWREVRNAAVAISPFLEGLGSPQFPGQNTLSQTSLHHPSQRPKTRLGSPGSWPSSGIRLARGQSFITLALLQQPQNPGLFSTRNPANSGLPHILCSLLPRAEGLVSLSSSGMSTKSVLWARELCREGRCLESL